MSQVLTFFSTTYFVGFTPRVLWLKYKPNVFIQKNFFAVDSFASIFCGLLVRHNKKESKKSNNYKSI